MPPLPSVQTVDHVDLNMYKGIWYEQARLDIWFERGCTNTTAEYTPLPGGGISVINRCLDAAGKPRMGRADAKPIDSTNSKLKVRFSTFWPRAGDYWIIHLGGSGAIYTSAVVGSPDRKAMWILSRSPR